MKKYFIIVSLVFCLLLILHVESMAQCPMCKMAAESNMKEGGTMGKGLNTGILYLLAMPYLAVFTFAMLYKRNRKKIPEQTDN